MFKSNRPKRKGNLNSEYSTHNYEEFPILYQGSPRQPRERRPGGSSGRSGST